MPAWKLRTRHDRLEEIVSFYHWKMASEAGLGPGPFPESDIYPHRERFEEFTKVAQTSTFDEIDAWLNSRGGLSTLLHCDTCKDTDLQQHVVVMSLEDTGDDDEDIYFHLCHDCLKDSADELANERAGAPTSPGSLKVTVPFSQFQVNSINEYQESGVVHPLTCGTDGCGFNLSARHEGLFCSRCNYTQDWVLLGLTDHSWKPNQIKLKDD